MTMRRWKFFSLKQSGIQMGWHPALALVTSLLCGAIAWSCFPGSGHVEVFGDGAAPSGGDAKGGLSDAGRGSLESGATKLDRGTAPLTDGTNGKVDTKTAAGPQPPFGSSVGVTAANFTGVPDCNGKLYSLYDYYNQKRGVILAIMSPS
jgi:hypothetical protein